MFETQLLLKTELDIYCPEIAQWLKPLYNYGNSMFKRTDIESKNVIIYTKNNSYSITYNIPTQKNPNGYLGCIASSLTYRPGENWTRGNDLPDGPFHQDTWNSILSGIISYEMTFINPSNQIRSQTIAMSGNN